MPGTRRNRGVETVVATVTAAVLCAGVWLLDHGTDRRHPPLPSSAAARTAGDEGPGTDPAARPADEPAAQIPALPIRIRVPGIGVDAPLVRLGLARDGSLEPPPAERDDHAGWYADGTVPGSVGTALIAGHVDNASGPAVFFGLGALGKGAAVAVDRGDGFTATFTVYAVEVYEGEDFPDRRVYGPSDRPELRLITCGGAFDEEADAYLGNVVVFARLTDMARTEGT